MSAALKLRPEIKIKLAVVKGPHAGQVFQFVKDGITLGRGPENNVVLINDPQISRVHAQINVVNNEIEIINLSQKNAVVIDGSSVQKWKLVNQALFTLGDSELMIEYDLGKAVVSVANAQSAEILAFKNSAASPQPKLKKVASSDSDLEAPIAKPTQQRSPPKNRAPALKQQALATRSQSPQVQQKQVSNMVSANAQQALSQQLYNSNTINGQYKNTNAEPEKNDSLMTSPLLKFILIGFILIGAGYTYLQTPNKKSQIKKIASTLKYEDEVNNKIYSKDEKKREEDRDYQFKLKQSSQVMRVSENFVRGMRDYQSGNYLRAQEFFQLVLNLEPDHALAKRHRYLSKARFDEILQEKLRLGESNYNKHNFKMCAAIYTQVMNMLDTKNTDPKYLLSEKKAKECRLANEGIR